VWRDLPDAVDSSLWSGELAVRLWEGHMGVMCGWDSPVWGDPCMHVVLVCV
jgi:hypothetical protein